MKIQHIMACAALACVAFAPQLAAQKTIELRSTEDSVSYAIGMNIGNGTRADSITLDPDALAAGMRDAQAGRARLHDTVARGVLEVFQRLMMAKQQAREQRAMDSMAAAGEVNKANALAFLAANRTKPNVIATSSGLQYEVLAKGTGATPKAADVVRVNYRGTLLDGTPFDASEDGTAQFNVGEVIPGWTQALRMMKVGSRWRLWVPPDLAYGMSPPPGGQIPSGALLIFEVELLGIVKKRP